MENRKVKIINISIVLCILILITIGAICYFNVVYNNNLDESTNSYKENSVSEESSIQTPNVEMKEKENEKTQIKKVNKLNDSKEIVYSSYETNLSEYSYKISYININSKDIDKINNEIEKYYKPLIEDALTEFHENVTVGIMGIKYDTYINNNILSLIIETEWNGALNEYKLYNVNIYDGTVIENSDLINLKQISENNLVNKLKELYKAQFIEEYGTRDEMILNMKSNPNIHWSETDIQEQSEFYDDQLQKTISNSNCSANVPMFLNANGNICVVANIYAMAGAESYERIIEVII